jgi:hypothetical protein
MPATAHHCPTNPAQPITQPARDRGAELILALASLMMEEMCAPQAHTHLWMAAEMKQVLMRE